MTKNLETQQITLANACTATAIGAKRTKNAKPVLCITTGEVFASITDAATKYQIKHSNLSNCLNGVNGQKTCKGMKFCFVSKSQEHYDEITQQMREKTTVIMSKQVVKSPVLEPEKETITIAQTTAKKHGWLRTYLINLFKKFATALEA